MRRWHRDSDYWSHHRRPLGSREPNYRCSQAPPATQHKPRQRRGREERHLSAQFSFSQRQPNRSTVSGQGDPDTLYPRRGQAHCDISTFRGSASSLDSLSKGLEFPGESDGDAQKHPGELLHHLRVLLPFPVDRLRIPLGRQALQHERQDFLRRFCFAPLGQTRRPLRVRRAAEVPPGSPSRTHCASSANDAAWKRLGACPQSVCSATGIGNRPRSCRRMERCCSPPSAVSGASAMNRRTRREEPAELGDGAPHIEV